MFSGSITRIIPIGAFVEILPGKEGMIHISSCRKPAEKVEDVVKVGDEVTVRCAKSTTAAASTSPCAVFW